MSNTAGGSTWWGSRLDNRSNPVDWIMLLPPSRPSATHLRRVRQHMARTKPQSVLILGSTPEFRDLCAELEIPSVTVIDCSLTFHRSVDFLRAYPAAAEEVIVEQWQQALPQLRGRFDCVLGDLVDGNIAYSDREAFYLAIAGALKPGGVFIEKILTNRTGYASLDSLDRNYIKGPINLATVNEFARSYFFTSEIVANGGVVDVQSIRAILVERFAGKPVLMKLLTLTDYVMPERGYWYYGLPWSVVARYRNRVFTVVKAFDETQRGAFCGRLELDIMIDALATSEANAAS